MHLNSIRSVPTCISTSSLKRIGVMISGHPDWEARVNFLRMFWRGKFFSINRRTIEQIVQQEWIGAGAS